MFNFLLGLLNDYLFLEIVLALFFLTILYIWHIFIYVLTPVKLKLFEDYLTEQLPLHIDFTKLINFIDKL